MNELRPRSVWDVVDDAFDLYRANFALFAGIVALVYVPFYLVIIGWMSTRIGVLLQSNGAGSGDFAAVLAPLLVGVAAVMPVSAIAYMLYSGAIAQAVEARLQDRPTGLFLAYGRALRRFWPLLGASCVVGLLAMAAGLVTILVFGLGAVAVFVFYAFVSQAVVLERRGVLAAVRRSRALVAGDGGKVLGLLVLLVVLSALLSLGITSLLKVALLFVPEPGDVATRQVRDFVWGQVAQSLGSVLLAPLTPIATTLLYYDLRVRREGLDLQAQAAAIGYRLAEDPFGELANAAVRKQAAASGLPTSTSPSGIPQG